MNKQNIPTVTPTQYFDFLSYWQNISQLDKNLLQYTEFLIHPNEIFTTLITDNIISVSDGGAKHETYGSFGLIIASMTIKQRLLKYKDPVYGSSPNSYRAEAYGIVATLRCIFHFINFYDCNLQLQ